MTHARTMHLDKTFSGLELFGLFYGIVLADLYRCSWFGNDGGDLNLWNGHDGSKRVGSYEGNEPS